MFGDERRPVEIGSRPGRETEQSPVVRGLHRRDTLREGVWVWVSRMWTGLEEGRVWSQDPEGKGTTERRTENGWVPLKKEES